MDFEKLKQEAFATAKAHGWHDEDLSDETYLMLIITEIAEAVQADRKGKHADVAKFNEYQTYYGTFLPSEEIRTIRFKEDFEEYIKNSVEDELADVVIRCLDMAGLRGIDFGYVTSLSREKTGSITSRFPTYMYCLCSMLTNVKNDLDFRLNLCVYSVVCYCKQKNIDIEFFIEQNMKYNKLRPFQHGNKKY